MINALCHTDAGHQNTVHQVGPYFGQLLPLRRLLLVPRGEMQLFTKILNAQLQLGTLKNALVSISRVLGRQRCSVTNHFLLRASTTHAVT